MSASAPQRHHDGLVRIPTLRDAAADDTVASPRFPAWGAIDPPTEDAELHCHAGRSPIRTRATPGPGITSGLLTSRRKRHMASSPEYSVQLITPAGTGPQTACRWWCSSNPPAPSIRDLWRFQFQFHRLNADRLAGVVQRDAQRFPPYSPARSLAEVWGTRWNSTTLCNPSPSPAAPARK